MPDDLDDLLRAAMKTLDDQVPSGYFEALPNQTLSRLEVSMQHGTSGTTDRDPATSAPPMAEQREEDSGLHDIRSLAQSTKQRLSSKRITTSPPVSEDDLLASSSAGWKAVALPQPAKMVSLPEIDELPSKAEIKAQQKAAKKTVKAEGSGVSAKPVAPAPAPAAAVEAAPARSAFSLPSQQRKKSKAPLIAVLTLGVAAAAGGVLFMQSRKDSAGAPAAAMQQDSVRAQAAAVAPKAEPAPPPAPTVEAIATGSAAADETAPAEAAAAGAAAPAADTGKDTTTTTKAIGKGKAHVPAKTDGKKAVDETRTQKTKTSEADKVETKKPDTTKKNADGSEPNFDDLLKEAGVDQNKKSDKPKLDKKMLSGDDFKNGMAAVAARAQACYKGTQGTASVKLTIAPSGKVAKVTVGGAFAGKPEAECVAGAVKGATFPPWDGGPQSFNYTYLLSE